MNHTPPPSGAAPGGAPQNAPFGAGFFSWIRGLGIGRGGDRWFAGVAGGIAARANVDPIIVRGIFIVLALLGGPGIILYLAGWLLLPDQGGRIHLEEVFRGRAGTAAVVATVAVGVFIVFPAFFRILGFSAAGSWGLWNFMGLPDWLSTTLSVILWIAVIAAAGFLISRVVLEHGRKVKDGSAEPGGQRPAGDPSTAQAPASFAMGSTPGSYGPAPTPGGAPTVPEAGAPDWTQKLTDGTHKIAEGAQKVSEQAASWSEDVGKQADDWSARYAEQHDLTRLGAAHVVITLALALLGAGTAAFIAFDQQLSSGFVLTAALLGATAVLAVSIIIAGVRGRRTGWVGFLAACGVLALLFTSVLPPGSKFQPFGSVTVGTSAPGSVLLAGNTYVDLTELDRTGGTHDIEVWQLAGRSVVTLPTAEPVVLTVRVLAGAIDGSDLDRAASTASGPLISRTIDTRIDTSEPATRVNVHLLAGSVRVVERSGTDLRVGSSYDTDSATEIRAELREELAELRDDERELVKELDSAELSALREERLENTLDFTRDEIAKLEKELAR